MTGRRLLIIAGLAALVVAGLVLAARQAVDPDRLWPRVAGLLGEATGLAVIAGGEVSVALFPGATVTVRDVRLRSTGGGTGPDTVAISELVVGVGLLPLLTGAIEIRDIVLDRPVLRLGPGEAESGDEGEESPSRPAAGQPGEESSSRPAADQPGPGPAIDFSSVSIRDGSVLVVDGEGGEVWRATGLALTVRGDSLAGPWRGNGEGAVMDQPVGFDLTVARPGAIPAPLTLSLSFGGAGATARFEGTLEVGPAGPVLAGDLAAEGADFGAFAAILAAQTDSVLPGTVPARPFSLTAGIGIDAAGMEIADGRLDLDGAAITGSGAWRAATNRQAARLEAVLAARRIDPAAWQPAPALEDGDGGNGEGEGGAAPGGGASANPAGDGLRWLGGFLTDEGPDLDIVARVDGLAAGGGLIRDLEISLARRSGAGEIRRLAAEFPGRTRISLTGGSVVPSPDGPVVDAEFGLVSGNFRELLTWLGANVEMVPGDRLRRAELSARLLATPEEMRLAGLDLSVDLIQLLGEAVWRPAPRSELDLNLQAVSVDLDAYLPRGLPLGGALTGPGPGAGATTGSGNLDVSLLARAASVRLGGREYRRVRVDARLGPDGLSIGSLGAGDGAGIDFLLSGHIGDPGRLTDMELDIELSATDAGDLLREVGLRGPAAGGTAAPGSLRGTVGRDRFDEPWAVSGEIGLDGRRIEVTGMMTPEISGGRPGVFFDLQTPEIDLPWLAGLAGLAGLGGSAAARTDAPDGTATGGGTDPAADGETENRAGGGPLTGLRLRSPAMAWHDLRLEDVVLLLRPAGAVLGLERLEARLAGGGISVGPAAAGQGWLDFTVVGLDLGAMPVATGDLRIAGGRLSGDGTFLPPGNGDPGLVEGEAHIRIEGGRLEGFSLAGVNARLADPAARLGLVMALAAGAASGDSEIRSLEGDLSLADGIARSNGLVLDATGGSGVITGEVDLIARRVAASAAFRFDVLPGAAPPLVLRVDGDLDSPAVVIDFQDLQNWLRSAAAE